MWRPESVYDERGHLDEGVIHAWLDGALERDAAREVEAHAEACVTCSARVSEARGLIAGASRVLGALDDAPGGTADIARRSPVDAGIATSSRKPRRWWATRTIGLAAAAVFVFAAGSVVLRDQLGGSGGVREAVMADQAAAPERAAAASESSLAAPAPASGVAGGAAPKLTAGGRGGASKAAAPARAAAPEAGRAPAAAFDAPRAQVAEGDRVRAEPPAPAASPLPLGAPASASPPPANDQAAEPARRREVASNKAAAAARVAAPTPAEVVHLRGQVASADSTAVADSAIRQRWPAASMKLEAVVTTGLRDATTSGHADWIGRCWRRAGSDTLVRFIHSDTADARPSGRDGAWSVGERLVGDSIVATFEWLEERDGRGVRIRTPGRRGELRLRVAGDSLLEGRMRRGERVRLEALPGSCP